MTTATAGLHDIRAILFDLDGVLTPTAVVHRHAWARLFTDEFERRGAARYTEQDYFAFLDGKPRYDGVASILASRGIELPWGSPDDPPEAETVCGLGNRKNTVFTETLKEEGVTPYPGSIAFLDAVLAAGLAVAVVSSSRNAAAVLAASGLASRFDVVMDGTLAEALGLPGKPAPDTFRAAAERLGVPFAACAVVEDAESGVAAGAAGGFGSVIGVDRGVGRDVLLELGADIVVDDLGELVDAVAGAQR
jgi:beta-phosphoglucomutase family hydrolase